MSINSILLNENSNLSDDYFEIYQDLIFYIKIIQNEDDNQDLYFKALKIIFLNEYIKINIENTDSEEKSLINSTKSKCKNKTEKEDKEINEVLIKYNDIIYNGLSNTNHSNTYDNVYIIINSQFAYIGNNLKKISHIKIIYNKDNSSLNELNSNYVSIMKGIYNCLNKRISEDKDENSNSKYKNRERVSRQINKKNRNDIILDSIYNPYGFFDYESNLFYKNIEEYSDIQSLIDDIDDSYTNKDNPYNYNYSFQNTINQNMFSVIRDLNK